MFVRISFFFATSLIDTKYMPADGCVAAIFEQFLKGNIDSGDVAAIFNVIGLYNHAIQLNKRKNPPMEKIREVLNEAHEAEYNAFKTEHIWSSLAYVLKTLGGGGTKQKECFYLTTLAIESCKDKRDVTIEAGTKNGYRLSVQTAVKDMFDFFSFKDSYELMEENEGRITRCYVKKVG